MVLSDAEKMMLQLKRQQQCHSLQHECHESSTHKFLLLSTL